MTPSTKRFILEQLKTNRIMSLATVANDGLALYFACYNKSQKVRNLRRSPKVSLTINKDTAD